MTFKDAIKQQLISGFEAVDIPLSQILVTMAVTFVMALYIYLVYRLITSNAFYSRDFNLSIVVMSLVTAGIIIAMQSSLVISLGMVGALSIVRFRSAIKEPLDLFFLLWSIGHGIICGAGLYKVSLTLAVCVTAAIIILRIIPDPSVNRLLFIGARLSEGESLGKVEDDINGILKEKAGYSKLRSRNITGDSADLIYEIRTKDEADLVSRLSELPALNRVSAVGSNGEFRG